MNVILVAALAVVANDAVVGVKVILVAALAVVANDADVAVVALPVNEPVNPPFNTFRLPVNESAPDTAIDPLKVIVSAVVVNEPLMT